MTTRVPATTGHWGMSRQKTHPSHVAQRMAEYVKGASREASANR